jgi:uncharacterized membrane protein
MTLNYKDQSRIETKVKASTAGALLSSLAIWALGAIFHKHVSASTVVAIQAFAPAVVAFIAGYLAPHTSQTKAFPPAPVETTQHPEGVL